MEKQLQPQSMNAGTQLDLFKTDSNGQSTGELRISSREIAELTGKEHRNVLRDCDALNENYEKMGLLKIEQGYYTHKNTGNQKYREYLLTKIQTLDLMTGYKVDLRIKVNRRWEELEKQQGKIKLPQTYKEALLELVAKLEENEKLQLENTQQKQVIGELQPKATYYDLILSSVDCLTITQIAKDYGMSGHQLNQFLADQKIQYKQSRQWLLYSNYHREGYTKSETVSITYKDGSTGSVLHTKWTQKRSFVPLRAIKTAQHFTFNGTR